MRKFFFFEKMPSLSNSEKVTILVPRNIMEKEKLFQLYSLKLNFPSYFGKNWDALYDLLTDLSWIKFKEILIIHEDIPFNNSPIEKAKYIKLLADTGENWKSNESHILIIEFPMKYETEVESLI